MAITGHKPVGAFTLVWDTDQFGTVTYRLTEIDEDGAHHLALTFEQGPFDTALEVAQWAWRALAVRLPPSRC